MRLNDVQTRGGRDEVTSTVCFAFADMAAIRAMKSEIPGDHVQLVPGIERDLEGLVVQLLSDAPALIVVVHSEALSAERLEDVLATFSKQRSRNHRLCVVEFDRTAPAAFLEGVRAAVDDMRGRSVSSPVATPTSRVASGPISARRKAAAAVAESRPMPVLPPEQPPEVAETAEDVTELAAAYDRLYTTNPGPSESGTTFPDLRDSISSVRRAEIEKAHRRAWRQRTAMATALAGVVACAAWVAVSRIGSDGAQPASAAGPNLPVRRAALAKEQAPEPASRSGRSSSPAPVPRLAADGDPEGAAESRRVAAALDAQQIHALDALLIRGASGLPESFAEARKRCAKLDVASLRGWRLPSLDELRTLRRARMLPEGEFWSASWVGGTVLFTLSRDVTRPQERERSNAQDVQTLCVRQR